MARENFYPLLFLLLSLASILDTAAVFHRMHERQPSAQHLQ
jgi:hypothetical protein